MSKYTAGLDFGTNSVRALIVDVNTGEEVATGVWEYEHGEAGIILSSRDPEQARQHPADYLKGVAAAVKSALEKASADKDFSPDKIISLGVDATGSTPMPIDKDGQALAMHDEFNDNPNAMAWLWKDHTSYAEAAEITDITSIMQPEYLGKCGGTYSSEWFWSKITHCERVAPDVAAAAYTWVEIADWLPAVLTGTNDPAVMKRGICAAGHKAMFNPNWSGYPDIQLVKEFGPQTGRVRETLPDKAYTISDAAGTLTEDWAGALGLKPGIPVAVGALDAHLGAVGSGITPGVLVKIIGTSTCDMMVAPFDMNIPDIPGLCGIVPESILPGAFGFEAGQSAVGDIFNWFVNYIQPGGPQAGSHEALTKDAEKLKPGESGLIGLDWHNGNRTILVDQRLTGLLMGMTLQTKPAEIYRALIESTAFGARRIIERLEEYGMKVERVINCGGISVKNPMVMQIYADATGRPMEVSQSEQTCALGSAVAAAVVAGSAAGGYDNFGDAVKAMTRIRDKRYVPDPVNVEIYNDLYNIYKRLHDIYGTETTSENLHDVMKELLEIRDEVRAT